MITDLGGGVSESGGEKKTYLRIAIQVKRHTINIGRNVVRILGFPSHICLLISSDRSSLAICPSNSSEAMAFCVPAKFIVEKNCIFRIISKQFVGGLVSDNHLASDITYRVSGKYVPEHNAVVFPLDTLTPWKQSGG